MLCCVFRVQVSASFGSEIWKAENYGQVAYAIRTRAGDLYFKMLRRNGDLSCFEALASDDAQFRSERAGGTTLMESFVFVYIYIYVCVCVICKDVRRELEENGRLMRRCLCVYIYIYACACVCVSVSFCDLFAMTVFVFDDGVNDDARELWRRHTGASEEKLCRVEGGAAQEE